MRAVAAIKIIPISEYFVPKKKADAQSNKNIKESKLPRSKSNHDPVDVTIRPDSTRLRKFEDANVATEIRAVATKTKRARPIALKSIILSLKKFITFNRKTPY